MTNNSKNTWKSQSGFIWSLIGSAVGFANVLGFSAKAYKNGGGAYLIPYTIALFVIGIPFLILEGMIGHRWKAPLVTAYGISWKRVGKVFGWMGALACITIGAFYIVLTGYSLAYTFFSATHQIPEDTKEFFLKNFLKATPDITHFGPFSGTIFLATSLVGMIAWIVMRRSVRDGIERICSIFMPMLVVIMTAFAVSSFLLPGGSEGLIYYLKPNFSKLLDVRLWSDVFGQLFFSLSLGLGIIVGYSRHTEQQANIPKSMLYMALGDFAVSLISGAAIFGCLAHISHVQGIPFDQVLTSDSTFDIGFIIFPKILKTFGPFFSQLIGILFFFCIFIAGITGVFSIIESAAGNIEVEFRFTRKNAVTLTIALIFILSCFFCFGNASHMIDSLAPMVLGTNMLLSGLILLLAFKPGKDFIESSFIRLCLKGVAPIIISIILIGNLWMESGAFDLSKTIRWGWFFVALALATSFSFYQRRVAAHSSES